MVQPTSINQKIIHWQFHFCGGEGQIPCQMYLTRYSKVNGLRNIATNVLILRNMHHYYLVNSDQNYSWDKHNFRGGMEWSNLHNVATILFSNLNGFHQNDAMSNIFLFTASPLSCWKRSVKEYRTNQCIWNKCGMKLVSCYKFSEYLNLSLWRNGKNRRFDS